MADNTIKLFPIDNNEIVLADTNEILLVPDDPGRPDGWEPNSGSTELTGKKVLPVDRRGGGPARTPGGSDIKSVGRSGGVPVIRRRGGNV